MSSTFYHLSQACESNRARVLTARENQPMFHKIENSQSPTISSSIHRGNSASNSEPFEFSTCNSCTPAIRHSLNAWMDHLVAHHPIPKFWPSSRAEDIDPDHPYTSVVQSHKRRRKGIVPRPLNSFMIFAHYIRRTTLRWFPDAPNVHISQKVGSYWRNLSESVREQYIQEGERLRDLHNIEFPSYKYQPKKRIKANPEPEKSSPSQNLSSTGSCVTPDSMDEHNSACSYVSIPEILQEIQNPSLNPNAHELGRPSCSLDNTLLYSVFQPVNNDPFLDLEVSELTALCEERNDQRKGSLLGKRPRSAMDPCSDFDERLEYFLKSPTSEVPPDVAAIRPMEMLTDTNFPGITESQLQAIFRESFSEACSLDVDENGFNDIQKLILPPSVTSYESELTREPISSALLGVPTQKLLTQSEGRYSARAKTPKASGTIASSGFKDINVCQPALCPPNKHLHAKPNGCAFGCRPGDFGCSVKPNTCVTPATDPSNFQSSPKHVNLLEETNLPSIGSLLFRQPR